MGYKATLRSLNGAINRSSRASQAAAHRRGREHERQQRQIHALQEKLHKKMAAAEEKRNRPTLTLKELYAAGKIDNTKFEDLLRRDSEITIDLIIFGRNAGVKLAERYIVGKIDTAEFENLKNEILGSPEAEKDSIVEGFKAFIDDVNDFISKSRSNKKENECNYCGRPKKFFSPLFKESDFKLCGVCKLKFKKLSEYPGYQGSYYQAEKTKVVTDKKTDLTLSIQTEHLLAYR